MMSDWQLELDPKLGQMVHEIQILNSEIECVCESINRLIERREEMLERRYDLLQQLAAACPPPGSKLQDYPLITFPAASPGASAVPLLPWHDGHQ